jgi:hypothetical protein
MSATANELPEWLPEKERSWVAGHEAALEAILAAFMRDRQWPDPVALERKLRSRGTKIGLIAAVGTMPQSLGRREHSPPLVVLTVFGLACVPSAAWVLDAYVAALRLALLHFDDPVAPSVLTRADLQEHLELDDLRMDIVSTVILLPGNPFLSGGQSSVEAWRRDIDERVTTYEDALTADALLAQLARERLTPSAPSSSPAPPPPTSESRGWLTASGLLLAVGGIGGLLIGILTAPLPLTVGVLAAGQRGRPPRMTTDLAALCTPACPELPAVIASIESAAASSAACRAAVGHLANPTRPAVELSSAADATLEDCRAAYSLLRSDQAVGALTASLFYPHRLKYRLAVRTVAEWVAEPARLDRLLAGEPVLAKIVEIHPSRGTCNYRCAMCLWSDKTTLTYATRGLQAQGLLSTQQWLYTIEDLRARGVQTLVISGGGEALLNPDLPVILR